MRLLTFSARGQTRLGAEAGAWVIDLNRAGREYFGAQGGPRAAGQAETWLPPSMTEFLAGGNDAMAAAGEATRHVHTLLNDPSEATRLQREGIAWRSDDVR